MRKHRTRIITKELYKQPSNIALFGKNNFDALQRALKDCARVRYRQKKEHAALAREIREYAALAFWHTLTIKEDGSFAGSDFRRVVIEGLSTCLYSKNQQVRQDAAGALVSAIKKYPDKVTFFFKEKGMGAFARCLNSLDLKKKDSSITALLEALPKRKKRRRRRKKIKKCPLKNIELKKLGQL